MSSQVAGRSGGMDVDLGRDIFMGHEFSAEVLEALNAQVTHIMRTPEMKARMSADGLIPVGSSRAEFAAHIRAEREKWAKVIAASGARVD